LGKSRSGFENFNFQNSRGLANGTAKMAIHDGGDDSEEGKMQLLIFKGQIRSRASPREIGVLSIREKTSKKESKNLYKHRNNKLRGALARGIGFFVLKFFS
jgi:hypothetical protein